MTDCSNKRYLMYIAQNYSYAMLRPLQQQILALGGEVRWFLEGSEVSAKYLSVDEICLNTVDDVKQWQPDAVFVPGNTVPNFIPGLKVDIFHGFNAGKINRRGREDHFEIRNCFDLYCTQGPDTTTRFKALAEHHGFFEVKETGWPALDPLFKPDLNVVNPYIDKTDHRPTVLLCSTFSHSLTCAPIIFEEIKRLTRTNVTQKWRWLVQFHPKMEQSIVDQYKSIQNENLTFIETDNVIPLLQAADVMLCDTSSILLMFLLQQKPVVTFRNKNPKPYLLDVQEVADVEPNIELALKRPADYMKNVIEYGQLIHPDIDGLSSLRVLTETNKLIEKGLSHLKPKPLNWLRNFKARRALNYWKL